MLEIPDFFFFLGGGGDLSDQVFLGVGGTEQMLVPSLCSRKKSEYPPGVLLAFLVMVSKWEFQDSVLLKVRHT